MSNLSQTACWPIRCKKVRSWILFLGLGLSCGVFAGCDLGTYNKRLNERTAPATEAKSKTSDADTTTEDDSSKQEAAGKQEAADLEERSER